MMDSYQISLVWLGDGLLSQGMRFTLRSQSSQTQGVVLTVKTLGDIRKEQSCSKINESWATINIRVETPISLEADSSVELFDIDNKLCIAKGTVLFPLYRSTNVQWQMLDVNKNARAMSLGQRPLCIWLTGLSGAGKSTIANLLEKRLHSERFHTYLLDGDNVRHGLNQDLGFTEADRVENIRRVAEVSKLMVDAGLIVIASFISPFAVEREMARRLFEKDEFIEVYVHTSIEECERRDVKGLYAKVRRGELKNFTGIDSPYEAPQYPDVVLDTQMLSAQESVEKMMAFLNDVSLKRQKVETS